MNEENILMTENIPNVETEIVTIDYVEVASAAPTNIALDSAFPAVGTTNEQLRHTLLNERDAVDQHPIVSITGLREELDQIKSLKTEFSDGKYLAEYHYWHDENGGQESRIGYFVSLVEGTDHVEIGGNDIYGVTVDPKGASFVGKQVELGRGYDYAAVCVIGNAQVLCSTSVVAGDYVVSDDNGIAKKTDSGVGYKVISVELGGDLNYALISIVPSPTVLDKIQRELDALSKRVDTCEGNIVIAINRANSAYQFSENNQQTMQDEISKVNQTITDVVVSNDEVIEALNKMNEEVVIVKAQMAAAQEAITTVQYETTISVNEAMGEVSELKKSAKKILEWEDSVTGNVGADYLVDYINNGLATKAEVLEVETLTKKANTATIQNAENIKFVATSVQKYSVGSYSQIYGLTYEQIVDNDIFIDNIYVPTVTHTETYSSKSQDFRKEYHYQWDGEWWVESSTADVYFSEDYVVGSKSYPYWFADTDAVVEYDGNSYEGNALYLWKDSEWLPVATLASNSSSRITSVATQMANKVSAEIVDARGNFATIGARIEDDESIIEEINGWYTDNSEALVATIQKADDNAAAITQLTTYASYDAIESVILGGTKPIGEFYEENPIWDDNKWNFAGAPQSEPTELCYALNPNNSFTYYKYTCIQGVWTRYTIGKTSEMLTMIQQQVDENSADIAIAASGGTKCFVTGTIEDTFPGKNATGVLSESPIWSGMWIPQDGTSITDDNYPSPCYEIFNETTYYQYIKTENGWLANIIESSTNIASIRAQVNEQGSSLSMIAEHGEVKGGMLIDVINDESSATINADRISLEGKEFNLTADDIKISSDNFNVTADGKITANEGRIAGWYLGSTTDGYKILSSDDILDGTSFTISPRFIPSRVGTDSLGNTGGTAYCIYYPEQFGVTTRGKLYAKDADIQGKITSSSGTIGGWTLDSSSLYSGTSFATANSFICTGSTDPMTIAGHSGTNWVLKAGSNFGVNTSGEMYCTAGNIGGWSITSSGLNSIGNGRIRNVYNGVGYQFSREGIQFYYGNDITTNMNNVQNYSAFIEPQSGRVYMHGKYHFNEIRFGSDTDYPAMTYQNGYMKLSGLWKNAEGDVITSDRNEKNTISSITQNYSVLFDNLRPVTFKYNEGTSDRLHMGFIAQEVKEAMDVSNTSSKDFAALCIMSEGTENESWALRYSEFIALNTYEIQKLKARVAELEEKLKEV